MAGAGMRAKIGPTGPDGKVFASNTMLHAAKAAHEKLAGAGSSLASVSGEHLSSVRAAALRRAPGEVKRHVAGTIRQAVEARRAADAPKAVQAAARPAQSYDEFRKQHPAERNFHKYDSDTRANLASSHRLTQRQRASTGEHFYTHPMVPGRAYPTAKAATMAAYEASRASGRKALSADYAKAVSGIGALAEGRMRMWASARTAPERVAAIQDSRPTAAPTKPQPSLRDKWYPPAETNPAFASKAAPKFSYAEPRLQRTADARMRAQRVASGIQARAAAEKRELTPAEKKLVASAKTRAASAIASGDRARNVIAKRATEGLSRNEARRERLKTAAEMARKRGDKARAAELEKRMDATQGVKVRYSRARADAAVTGKIAAKQPKAPTVAKPVEAPKAQTTEAKMPKAAKKPSTMTAGEINKELDRLDARSRKNTEAFIAAGRGHERPTDYQRKTDPLSVEANAIADRRGWLHAEISRRYGPGAPSRLPTRGFGPSEKVEAQPKAPKSLSAVLARKGALAR
jgi:hypothetical protein